MVVTDCLDAYFKLMQQKPELFADSPILKIVTDSETIEKFQCEHNKKIGVLYRSHFNTLVVDLVESDDGIFAYERIIPTAEGRGVVCIPVFDGKFIVLNQFRHSIRSMQLAFPRGFGEDGLTSEENAKKELSEEIGAETQNCMYLGSLSADSGLIGAECDVFLAHITSYDPKRNTEGITEILLMEPSELEEKVASRQIKDGFTLSAYSLLKTSKYSL